MTGDGSCANQGFRPLSARDGGRGPQAAGASARSGHQRVAEGTTEVSSSRRSSGLIETILINASTPAP